MFHNIATFLHTQKLYSCSDNKCYDLTSLECHWCQYWDIPERARDDENLIGPGGGAAAAAAAAAAVFKFQEFSSFVTLKEKKDKEQGLRLETEQKEEKKMETKE